MTGKSTRAMQTLMITSVTRHQQRFSTKNTKVNGSNNAAPIMQHDRGGMTLTWKKRRELIVNACVY
jgi:hypothetical protein